MQSVNSRSEASNSRRPGSLDALLDEVYPQLRALAGYLMRRERGERTLQPTALVHEARLRLLDQDRVEYENPRHLIAQAAAAMRRTLVDHARRRRATKRDGGIRLPMPAERAAPDARDLDLLAVNKALVCLAALDARQARLGNGESMAATQDGFLNEQLRDLPEIAGVNGARFT